MVVAVAVAVEKVVQVLWASPLFSIARFSLYNKKDTLDKSVFLCYARIKPRTALNLLWHTNCSIDWRKCQPFSGIFERRTTETAGTNPTQGKQKRAENHGDAQQKRKPRKINILYRNPRKRPARGCAGD